MIADDLQLRRSCLVEVFNPANKAIVFAEEAVQSKPVPDGISIWQSRFGLIAKRCETVARRGRSPDEWPKRGDQVRAANANPCRRDLERILPKPSELLQSVAVRPCSTRVRARSNRLPRSSSGGSHTRTVYRDPALHHAPGIQTPTGSVMPAPDDG